MDYFDLNIDAMKQNKIDLYAAILSYQEKTEEELENQKEELEDQQEALVPETVISKDGNPILLLTKEEKQYRMNSVYRPLKEAKTWAGQFNFQNLSMVITMFGFGNGYFVRELKARLKKGDILLVYEPNEEVFIHVLHNYNLKDVLEDLGVRILFGEKGGKEYFNYLGGILHWSNLNSFIECEHPQYAELFINEWKEYKRAVFENKERVITNRNTESFFSMEVIENLTNNMKYIPGSNYSEDVNELWSKEVPVIIVSAGPSLDINIEELKKAKGKSVILATDTALRALYKHGIEPDVVTTIDPKKIESFFDDVDFENIPLICNNHSSHYAMSKHKGKKIWFNCHEYFIQLHKKMGITLHMTSAGGSVATNAFAFARSLKAKTIILIGQDLAYKGDYTHAGSEFLSIGNQNDIICYLEGIDGKPVKSRFDWQYYLKWFERSIKDYTQEGNVVIDATEGGALIHNSEVMTLREAIDRYCKEEVHVREMLENLEPSLDEEKLKQLLTLFEKDYLDLSFIVRKTKESIDYCNKIIKEYKSARTITASIEKKVKRVSKNNRQMLGKGVYLLAEEIMKGKNLKMLETINDTLEDEFENTIDTYEKQKQMMVDLKDSAEELMPYLKKCMDSFSVSVKEWLA